MSTVIGQLSNPTQEDVATIIDGLLVAHPAWEFVGKYHSDAYWAYRCLGTHNSLGSDFYYFMQVGVQEWFAHQICEDINESNQAVNPAVDGRAVGADAGAGAYSINSSNLWPPFAYVARTAELGASTRYVIDVTDDRIVVALGDKFLYAGAYDSHVRIPNNHPLCCAADSSSYGVNFTRHPGREGNGANDNHFRGTTWNTHRGWTHQYPSSLDPFLGDKGALRPILVFGYTSNASQYGIYGQIRGALRDVWRLSATTGFVVGDTFKDGDDHVYVDVGGRSATQRVLVRMGA